MRSLHLIRRVLVNARRYWPHIAGIFLLTLLSVPVTLLKPYALKFLIDSGFSSQPVPHLIRVFFPANFQFNFSLVVIIAAALVIIIALIENLTIFFNWLLSTSTGEKLVLSFRALLFNHIQRLSIAYHDTKGTSDSLYRIQWDAMSVRALLLVQLPPLITSFITLISMTAIMLVINWRFAVIGLCIIPPIIFLTKLSNKRLLKNWYEVKDAESVAMSVVTEVLSSLRIVKAFGQEKNENERFVNRSDKAVKGQINLAKTAAGISFVVGMLLAVGTALFIYFGAVYVRSGQMTLGDLTLIIAYLTQIFGPLQTIVKNLNDVQSSVVSIDRIFSVLDEQNEVKEAPDALSLKHFSGGFEFQNVSFSYYPEKYTLKDISFNVKPGDRVGIMGSTGAGKSTLVSLLMRFYDPVNGNILVDRENIKGYKLADYRDKFAIVLQDPVLFTGTIKENIRYGRPEATEKEIIEAAIAANAHDFIMKGKDGYDTEVGERGMQLSGGERQRISIARAFIKNAPVLILDEPTSSVDIKTESLIIDAMERLMEGRTTFMITHRLDTLKPCNIILHLENGKLIDVVRDRDTDFLEKKKTSILTGI